MVPGRKVVIEEEVTKMLQAGVICVSDSPWSSPIVLVKEKEGTIHFCIDYRSSNDVTRKNSYPLPNIDNNLEALKVASKCSVPLWITLQDILAWSPFCATHPLDIHSNNLCMTAHICL